MNSVILIGRLTKDPVLEYVGSKNTAKATFTLAVDRPTKEGQEKSADFIRVIVWNKPAENCDLYLARGRMVAVLGRIQTGSYKNKDGATVYTTDVVANRVKFLEGNNREASATKEEAGAQPYRADEWNMEDVFAAVDSDIPY